nr:immunoglobulin light chain junction region [Macaca mulatta]MOW15238.1 immunoglobulin light chain junction region [Macaca mulatta]MOW16143.1 immunoglobulin light chain junction region [Macaca mulatta]MOW16598.1 immunoglobulin light chain junction region [Macaca mulatta]MOW17349.1 immunoglobulin light chain junction region [Macaca mulatta]
DYYCQVYDTSVLF